MKNNVKTTIDPTESLAAELQQMNERLDTLTSAVDKLAKEGVKHSIDEGAQKRIEDSAAAGVRSAAGKVRLPAPDLTPQASVLADAVYDRISARIQSDLSRQIDEAIESKKATIKVEHYHTNMYGRFASSEENRKMMIRLTLVIVILATALLIIHLRWFGIIKWKWGTIFWQMCRTLGYIK